MEPYRTPVPSYQVLDIACRRCGIHGLLYAYWPDVKPVAGPLCRTCCVEWQGLSKFVGGTAGVGYISFPYWRDSQINWNIWYGEVFKIAVITVPGERPDVRPWLDD